MHLIGTYCKFQVNTTQYDDIVGLFENNKATVTVTLSFHQNSNCVTYSMDNPCVNSTVVTDLYKTILN